MRASASLVSELKLPIGPRAEWPDGAVDTVSPGGDAFVCMSQRETENALNTHQPLPALISGLERFLPGLTGAWLSSTSVEKASPSRIVLLSLLNVA